MFRLLILAALGIAIGLFLAKFLSTKKRDNFIDGEVINADARPNTPRLIPILLLGALLAVVIVFILPRFGVSLMSLFQKAITFLPLIRGLIPF